MIISIEGVPATGKTTTTQHLVRRHGAVRIPEVIELYLRPDPESVLWYLQRQTDRWTQALQADGPDRLVVLDGDPYQPVWLSWIYPERDGLTWQDSLGFFEDRLERVSQPGFHVYLFVSPEVRFQRVTERTRASGQTHARVIAKYRKYETMLGPQKAFFTALGGAFPGFVLPCEARSLAATAETILAHEPPAPPECAQVLTFMREWLGAHEPDQFVAEAADRGG